jgi:hypothetical protein
MGFNAEGALDEGEAAVIKNTIMDNLPPDASNLKNGCLCAFVGTIICIGIALFYLSSYPRVVPPNMDGMNRWGGHMALIMFAFVFGGVGGAFVGGGKEPVKTVAVTVAVFIITMLWLT